MNILAVDPGSKLGWALLVGEVLESGVEDFSLKRGESPGARYLRFRRWLADTDELAEKLTGARIALIVYEQAHHRGGFSTEVLVGFTTRLQEHAAAAAKCECVAVHSGTLKKFATGRGNAQKPEMMDAATQFWGVIPKDDNHADALCLLAWGRETYGTKPAAEEA